MERITIKELTANDSDHEGMETPDVSYREALPLDEAVRTFSLRPYWRVFQENVADDVRVTSPQLGVTYAVATYKHDPTIELRLERNFIIGGSTLPFESETGMIVIRKGTSRKGVITHGMSRSPKTYEEALFSSMLEEPKKSNWGCGFDFGLRKVTNELYRQFEEKFHPRRE